MKKKWITIKSSKRVSIKSEIFYLKKKGVILSPWIENIFFNKKNRIKLSRDNVDLYKIKVKNLGFLKPTTLQKIYKRIIQSGYKLVEPDLALRARLHYKNQKKREWLRFATPFNSMIDTDGVPHLPKLGRALNKYFIETYWSYKKAIFHPHNEFIVKKDEN